MEKLERQLGLLAALLHTERPLPAAEIQQQVEGYPEDKIAFRRAFERDKEDLRRLGVPIQLEPTQAPEGTIDGYRVRESDYYLHDLGLEPDEVVALSMALRLIRLEGVQADDALWKLGGTEARAEVDPAEVGAISMGPAVTQIYEAITAEATIEFRYRDDVRVVEPWRLAFRRGQWYLHAWDVDRADERSFRLDRIDGGLEVGAPKSASHQRSVPRDDRQPWQFGNEDDAPIDVRVAIDAGHARWAKHHLRDAEVVAEHPDGSIEITVAVSHLPGFRTLVLSMLDGAEILSPPQARADMIAWLEGQQP